MTAPSDRDEAIGAVVVSIVVVGLIISLLLVTQA